MFRSLAAALITHEHIETTDARAKELRRVTDRLVTLGKKGTLHARRQAYKYLNSHQLVQKLFDEIAPRFSDRPGGYTRLVKSRIRFADQAPMTFVRFVTDEMEATASKDEVAETVESTTVEAQVKAGVDAELKATAEENAALEVEVEKTEPVATETEVESVVAEAAPEAVVEAAAISDVVTDEKADEVETEK
jgi:large subunit ribosomal protein L17